MPLLEFTLLVLLHVSWPGMLACEDTIIKPPPHTARQSGLSNLNFVQIQQQIYVFFVRTQYFSLFPRGLGSCLELLVCL